MAYRDKPTNPPSSRHGFIALVRQNAKARKPGMHIRARTRGLTPIQVEISKKRGGKGGHAKEMAFLEARDLFMLCEMGREYFVMGPRAL